MPGLKTKISLAWVVKRKWNTGKIRKKHPDGRGVSREMAMDVIDLIVNDQNLTIAQAWMKWYRSLAGINGEDQVKQETAR